MANIGSSTPQDPTPKTILNQLYDTAATMAALNCSRWKIWEMCRNDPEFPRPRDIAGKNQWTQQEIEDYKLSRPRRIYAAVAMLAMVSITALSFAISLLA